MLRKVKLDKLYSKGNKRYIQDEVIEWTSYDMLANILL